MRLSISPRIALGLALGGFSIAPAAHGQETPPPAATTETPAAPATTTDPAPGSPAPASPATPAPAAEKDAATPTTDSKPAPAAATDSKPIPAAPGTPAAPTTTAPAATAPATPHTALFRYYDKNGDQVLSADELTKVPQPIREWLDKQKVDVAAGLTKEAFETSAPKLVEHLRTRTAETILAPVPLPAPGSVPAPTPSSGGGRSQRGNNGGSSEFRALDLDGDAQLSFREWRAGKRLAGEFQPRDMNGDGVVTASEFDQTKALASTTPPGSSGSSRPSTPGAPMAQAAPGSTPTTPGTTPPASTGTTSTPANSGLGNSASRQTFESLDKNRDGVLTPEELSGSRRVGPAFKEKGIDISKNMTREDFHANYAKAFPPR